MPRSGKKGLVLVTGGAGFIGSHLVDALIQAGYKVRVMDALLPPSHNGKLPEWFNKKAEFMRGDVRNKKDWEKALRGVSYVFHLAAYMDYHLDFSVYVDTNVRSTALLYEVIVSKKLPVKKVIIASSQSVYGEGKYRCRAHGDVYASPRALFRLKKKNWAAYCHCGRKFTKALPEKESDALMPLSPYGVSKQALEGMALSLGKKFNIPTVIVRYSIVHGTRQSWRNFYSGALRSFAVQALAGDDIEMHEDGGATRDFVHIADVTSAHLLLMKDRKADHRIFNIGSGKATRIIELYKAVKKAVPQCGRPILKGVYRAGTARDSFMDISSLRKLGWKPKKKLEDNVRDYVEWVKKYPQAITHLRKTYSDLKRKGIVA